MCVFRIANHVCQREIKKNDVAELYAAALEWSFWLKELVGADPTTDCRNVLLELASLHWAKRMAAAGGKEEAGVALLDDDEKNKYTIWGPNSRVELGNSADILGFDCSTLMKKYFENQDLSTHVDFDLKSIVKFGRRLWSPDQAVFGCSMNHKEDNITSFFIKLCIRVDINKQNGPRASVKELTYFSEAVSYLKYKPPDGSSRLPASSKHLM
ncbi:hypothetical protein BCV72DRAFT_303456 [Rhizopus microsporus var. microsporus]|uniref:Uncharacterized protein n=1 Tax=Rhizopus microsporus var. microsporus TaxID=86635 RepID=A0A1X0R9Y6_RHIZD|nr:hypothetical protein BCV72DRAFT_303456 [Rhizopus microsporus var. microsporus]